MQHPYLHPIEVVDYLVDHQLLVMVQPLVHSGSLKDMIYKVHACSCIFKDIIVQGSSIITLMGGYTYPQLFL